MNQILLQPTDVLFFRDGRPMGGALAGHGAAWPLPTVTSAALHAALHRSGLAASARPHARKVERTRSDSHEEHFGSLTAVGPFPVCTGGAADTWFFPRPLDADCAVVTVDDRHSPNGQKQTGLGSITITQKPVARLADSASSAPLPLAVASCLPPTKTPVIPWWSEGAWNAYLGTEQRGGPAGAAINGRLFIRADADFSDHEAAIGIGISAETGTQDGERIYSAHYLRLREDWRLGLFAATAEKTDTHGERSDHVAAHFAHEGTVLLGGQQRICTVKSTIVAAGTRLPLPFGMAANFHLAPIPTLGGPQPKHLVKWVLLSPAIFPAITPAPDARDAEGQPLTRHSGGWLPSWVSDDAAHAVLLRAPLPPRDVARESREDYRRRVRNQPAIAASLVAALVPKPIPVTGWSLGNQNEDDFSPKTLTRAAGAKPTHLAVPAGAVYYFACDSADDAVSLAAALNWHGSDSTGTTIKNRRSTLLGEKGFGLGVCGTWSLQS